MSETFGKYKVRERLSYVLDSHTHHQSCLTCPLPLKQDLSFSSDMCLENSLSDTNKNQSIEKEIGMVEILKEILPAVSRGSVSADLLFQVLQAELKVLKQ